MAVTVVERIKQELMYGLCAESNPPGLIFEGATKGFSLFLSLSLFFFSFRIWGTYNRRDLFY